MEMVQYTRNDSSDVDHVAATQIGFKTVVYVSSDVHGSASSRGPGQAGPK
jgi:hypothetical protein